jgi:glutamine amidotransferase-like uncharacterized protein
MTSTNRPLVKLALPVLLVAGLAHPVRGNDESSIAPLRVALYADAGVTEEDLPQIERCLPLSKGFRVERITADEIRHGQLARFDLLIHPGGSGSKQGNTLGAEGRDRVRSFVEQGGGFVGICAGAYLGSAQYPWSLNLLDARVVDGEHWARGEGDVELRLSSAGRSLLAAERPTATIYYCQGPLLAPAQSANIPDYEPLALYETEIAQNGAPAGVMKGTTAVARGQFGKGRVICFSPHPERTPALHPGLRAAARWTAGADLAE